MIGLRQNSCTNTIEPGGTLIYSKNDAVLSRIVDEKKYFFTKRPYLLPDRVVNNGLTKLITTKGEIALEIVKQSFANEKLNFFNNFEILEKFLIKINFKGKNLLLMSSGNFGGMNLDKLKENILGSSALK